MYTLPAAVLKQRSDLSTIGLVFPSVLGLVFAYSAVSFLLVFFVRDGRQRVRGVVVIMPEEVRGTLTQGNAAAYNESVESAQRRAESNTSMEFGSYGPGVYEGISGSCSSPTLAVRSASTSDPFQCVQISHETIGISFSAHLYLELGLDLDCH